MMRWNKGGNGGDGEGGSFEKPPVGYTRATLAAIYDLGVRERPGSKYGPKHTVCLWWELSHKDSKGANIGLRDMVTMSTMSGAHLAARVEAILGRTMTDKEREDFDPSTILGGSCKLLLDASSEDGNPWVKMAMPLEPTDKAPVVEGDYTAMVPGFVGKIVGDEMKAKMLADAASGGKAGLALGIKGNGGIVPGAAAGQPTAGGSTEPAAPPSAPKPPTPPSGLPAGWKAHVDAASGRPYYERPDGSTTWDKPATESAPPAPGGEDVPF